MKRNLLALGLLSAVALAACEEDGMTPPDDMTPTPRPLLGSYVSIGNSLTAGTQSGGINDSTQMEAYPVLVAQQMGFTIGTDFIIPTLLGDGCAPPIENIFSQTRINGGAATDCFGRVDASTPHNLGIPGAKTVDAVTVPAGTSNPYYTLFGGGMSQLDIAVSLDPTFVSVWLGANDVLGAAVAGDLATMTSLSDFETAYQQVLTTLDGMNLEGAILIGVPHVTSIPFLSPAAAYWVGKQMGSLPDSMFVDASCATSAAGGAGEATLVSFSKGFGMIGAATAGIRQDMHCQTDPEMLHLPEIATLVGQVARFNTMIERWAGDRGWAYWDPNPTLDSVKAAGGLALFPNTSGPDALFIPFGDGVSRDGVHPNAATHRVIADHVINTINAHYGRSIPNVP